MRISVYAKGDREASPVVEGEPSAIVAMLRRWGSVDRYEVYYSTSEEYEDARTFMVRHGHASAKTAITPEPVSPEQKMRDEDLSDPYIHARNEMVIQYVKRALRLVNEPNYDSELLAKNTAHQIIRLFY